MPMLVSPPHAARRTLSTIAVLVSALVAAVSLGTSADEVRAASGDISTVAGAGNGDGRVATTVGFGLITGVAVDSTGNVYFSERLSYRIRKVDAVTKVVSTFAGTGEMGVLGDGGPAAAAQLLGPSALAIGPGNVLYVADSQQVRSIDLTTGTINLFAGKGALAGDGVPAVDATLVDVAALAVDANENVYVADRGDNKIRKITAATGLISTFAGTGTAGSTGDSLMANVATLNQPEGVAVDASSVYISDTGGHRVRKVTIATGMISAYAGSGASGFAGDGGAATAAAMAGPSELSFIDGNLLITDPGTTRVRKVAGGVISTFTGTASAQPAGDGGPANAASYAYPRSIAKDTAGNIYIGDQSGHQVRRITKATLVASTIAGDGTVGNSGDNGPAIDALLGSPWRVVSLSNGDVVYSDQTANVLRRVSATTGVISRFAGTGAADFSGDGGPAVAATMSHPTALAVAPDDTVYFSDQDTRVRKIDPNGTITTVVGTAIQGSTGDNGPANLAQTYYVRGLRVLANGDLILVENGTRIRKVDHATNVITTVAGTGMSLDAGDGGPAIAASFVLATSAVEDSAGNLFVADNNSRKLRRIDALTKTVTTLAGTGASSSTGNGGPATAATFRALSDISIDAANNLYIADLQSNTVRRIDAATGVISAFAGSGSIGFAGDGGPAAAASMTKPSAVSVDPFGNVYVAEYGGQRIRKVDTGAVPFVVPDPPVTDPPVTDPPSTQPPTTDPSDPTTTDPDAGAPSNRYHPVQPDRLLDTRAGIGAALGPLVADGTLVLHVTGAGSASVPPDAVAVVLNITVTDPAAAGYVTAWPCGQPRPSASNLNFVADQTTPNLAIAKLGENGTVCLYTQSTTHLIADINGWYPAGTDLRSVQPERLLDTRFGIGAPTGAVPAEETLVLRVAGAGTTNVPPGAESVVLNITVTDPAAAGYVTAWPCDQPRPTASNLNYVADQTTPNLAIVKLGDTGPSDGPDNGTVCLYTQATTHLIADINGWYPAGSDLHSVQPERLLDTRLGIGAPTGTVPADGAVVLQIVGAGQTKVPADANAVVLNITVTEPEAAGYVTAWPCGEPRPTASNLNYVAGQTTPNLAIVKLGDTGAVCLYTQSATHLVADVDGWYIR